MKEWLQPAACSLGCSAECRIVRSAHTAFRPTLAPMTKILYDYNAGGIRATDYSQTDFALSWTWRLEGFTWGAWYSGLLSI